MDNGNPKRVRIESTYNLVTNGLSKGKPLFLYKKLKQERQVHIMCKINGKKLTEIRMEEDYHGQTLLQKSECLNHQ